MKTALTGFHLGMGALAAALRAVGPAARSVVEEEVCRLLRAHDADPRTVPWNSVIRTAIQQGVLRDGPGLWGAGPEARWEAGPDIAHVPPLPDPRA